MKSTFTCLFVCVTILFSSCEKESTFITSPLIGKWKLHETYLSIGGPLSYTPANPASPVYLQFDENGGLSMTNTDFKTYRLKDSLNVIFIKADKTKVEYKYRMYEGMLDLSPGGCIEGCGSRYIRAEE